MKEHTVEEFLKAYDAHADAIYRHCFFRVFSKAHAEELVQETFLRTWEYLQNGTHVDNVRAFLYRVANNLIIDRSRRKKEDSLEEVLEDAPGREPAAGGLEETERHAEYLEVMEVIKSLPEEEAEIITLRYVDELAPQEIAEALGITANNASVRLNRAMKSLRERLINREEP